MCRPNAYVALPVFNEFLMPEGLCLADLLEEKIEQDFLIRNKHVTAVRGHMDIQAMHFRDNERRKRRKAPTRRCDSFQYRFSHFRDLRVRTGFCDSSTVVGLQPCRHVFLILWTPVVQSGLSSRQQGLTLQG